MTTFIFSILFICQIVGLLIISIISMASATPPATDKPLNSFPKLHPVKNGSR